MCSYLEDDSGKKKLYSWLNGKKDPSVESTYSKVLGPGWKFPVSEAEPQLYRYLSSNGKLVTNSKADYPLVINWLITSRCLCKCEYCYSKDVMAKGLKEPDEEDIVRIANAILNFKPLAVVLTGGDPLCSDNLENILKCLYKKTGIIVDTNGFNFEHKHVRLFKKYKVFVRISFDSQNPKHNNSLRPSKNGSCSLREAINAIDKCLQNQIPVGIQTVVTKKNFGNIIPISEKLPRIGVQCWRLQIVANHKMANNFEKMSPNKKRFYKEIAPRIVSGIGRKAMGSMYVDVVHNNIPNSVILVLPDGGFFTELGGSGKIPIDPANVKNPSLQSFRDGVLNREGHSDRYLGGNDLLLGDS
jgi:MoaA/NifB/PqqE/SkfB family radical SAM enzyme